jgi:tripartite-type tricarboxylate transporter receptor subunit TctC
MNMRRILIAVLTLATWTGWVLPARAQAWPSARPIRIIVTAAPGSLIDTIARYVGDKLGKSLNQAVIVDNKPGGGNLIGVQAAARSPADGYTFLFGSAASFTTNSYLFKNLPYDPLRDFVAVSHVTRPGFTVAVNARLAIRNLSELAEYARSKPGGLSIAVDGPKNFTGLTAAYLGSALGMPVTLVAYANIVQGLQDTAAGNTDALVQGYGLMQGLIGKGSLRPIAVTSEARFGLLPEVPTVAESLPGFQITGWTALFAPAGVSAEVLTRMNREMDRILKDPATRVLADRNFQTIPLDAGSLSELDSFVKSQNAMWGRMVGTIGATPE